MKKTWMSLVIILLINSALYGQQAQKPQKWTIGVLTGPSVFELSTPEGITNPVLTAKDVSDIKVDILAHPFVIQKDLKYYMFFTAKNKTDNSGGIGVAESDDGLVWKYRKMAINEPFVVSHPYVFKWNNEIYMTPETNTESSVVLYRAIDFPDKWVAESILLKGDTYIRPVVIRHNNIWWMYTSPEGNESLRLFYSDELIGSWVEHPQSPVVEKEPDIARPAGRPIITDGKLYRMGMDCSPTYGNKVYALEVTKITKKNYSESLIDDPLIKASSEGWNAKAMHHVEAIKTAENNWIVIVDALGY